MQQNKAISKILIFMVFISLAFFIDSFSEFSASCENIREKVLRLHIIANSDSAYDQEIKLKIRDRILKESENLFYTDESVLSAKEKALENLEYIERIANNELIKNGLEPNAKAEFSNMFFNTRVYDNYTLPAGKYDAVRIIIGEGRGKNWWCVLYPGLCIPAVTKLDETFTETELDIIENTPDYEIKFFIVELFEKMKNF